MQLELHRSQSTSHLVIYGFHKVMEHKLQMNTSESKSCSQKEIILKNGEITQNIFSHLFQQFASLSFPMYRY